MPPTRRTRRTDKDRVIERLEDRLRRRNEQICFQVFTLAAAAYLLCDVYINPVPFMDQLITESVDYIQSIRRRRYYMTVDRRVQPSEKVKIDDTLRSLRRKGDEASLKRFRTLVRMTPDAFYALVDEVKHSVQFRGEKTGRPQTNIEAQIAVTLCKLGANGSRASYQDVADAIAKQLREKVHQMLFKASGRTAVDTTRESRFFGLSIDQHQSRQSNADAWKNRLW